MRIRDAGIGNNSIQLSVDDLIFDTGSSLCYMPKNEHQQFLAEVRRKTYCSAESGDGLIYCDCDSEEDPKFPMLTFKVGDRDRQHWFFLRGRDYLMFSQRKQKCALLVKAESSNARMWLMGDPFLRAYYSIYDMDNARIGFVGVAKTIRNSYQWEEPDEPKSAIDSAKQTVKDGINKVEGTIKENLGISDEDDWVVTVIISAGSCLITSIFCCIVNWCIKKRRQAVLDKELKE